MMLSIRTIVALIVAFPLIAMGFVMSDAFADSDRERGLADDVRDLSNDVVALASLEAQLTVESYWAGAVAAGESFGLAPDFVTAFVGVDLQGKYAGSIADVEARREPTLSEPMAEWADVNQLIERGRVLTAEGGHTGAEVVVPYYRAIDLLGVETDRRLAELNRLAEGFSHHNEVEDSIRALFLATRLRAEIADTAATYFGVRFPDQGVTENIGYQLTTAYVGYQRALDDFRAEIPDAGRLLATIDGDPRLAAFLTDVGDLVERLTDPSGGEIDGADDLIGEFESFQDSIHGVELHVGLIDVTSARLASDASSVTERAAATRDQAIQQALAVAAAAVLMVVVSTRWIIRPLRSIARRASRILDGDLQADASASGLREIRDAEQALGEAARNIRLAERQAIALANDELDASVLTVESKGRLGTALRSAFDRLRESISEREDYRDRLQHEAEHDALTGLPNRTAILWRLDRALVESEQRGTPIAALFLDVDKFKRINDQHGHEAGDRVLRAVARRIATAVRTDDHVGRLAGDEFVVVLSDVAGTAEALATAERIRAAVTAPIEVGATSLTPRISIGVAVSRPGVDGDELLRDADLAVYRAKSAVDSTVELCDDELRAELVRRTDIESRLLGAIDSDVLELHYQPIVDATSERVNGYEALLRWPGPGGLPPGAFIPIAERSDLIVDVDRWVIDRAARQLAEWSDDPELGSRTIAINVSARHLGAADLASTVLGTLSRHGVEPHRLGVEITESALLDDVEHAVTELARLREHGIAIAIDDFGTGHTSLSHLREFPIDQLKLDREFVLAAEADHDRPLAQLIVDAGHLVGAVVVAEGVETREQLEIMRRLGADEIQGFLFGRPVPPDRLVSPVVAATGV